MEMKKQIGWRRREGRCNRIKRHYPIMPSRHMFALQLKAASKRQGRRQVGAMVRSSKQSQEK
jgi:hypothetical protein